MQFPLIRNLLHVSFKCFLKHTVSIESLIGFRYWSNNIYNRDNWQTLMNSLFPIKPKNINFYWCNILLF